MARQARWPEDLAVEGFSGDDCLFICRLGAVSLAGGDRPKDAEQYVALYSV